jgi:small conductance mechanosensitive channel
MNTLFLPFLAQAGAVAVNGTNNVTPLIKPDRTILKKFEDATGLPPEVAVWGVNIAATCGVLVVGYVVAGIARNMLRRLLAKRHIDETVGDFVGNLAHAGIMTFVVITALGQLGVDTKTFAAVIAAAGLAIGLALQGGLSNFAAGFLIVVFRPFRKGDVISVAGIEGTVEEVQVFSTTLHTADNKKIIVPNNSIMAGTITNYTANPVRRIDLTFGVGAGQDLSKAHQALLSLIKSEPRIVKDPAPDVVNLKLIDGGTLIELHAWCKTPEFGAVSSDLIARAPDALAGAGIKGPDKSVVFVERK